MSPEVLLAAVSLKGLQKGAEFTPSVVAKGSKLLAKIDTEVKKIVKNGVKPKALSPDITVEDLDKVLDHTFDASEEAEKLILAGYPEGVVGSALNLWQYLDSVKPTLMAQGAFIPLKQLDIPYSDKARYLWALRVANDPLWVLDLFSAVQLTATDVEHLSAMYPEIYTHVVNAFVSEFIAKYDDENSIDRPMRMMLSVLVGEPVLSVNTLTEATPASIAVPEGGI